MKGVINMPGQHDELGLRMKTFYEAVPKIIL